MSLRLWLLNFGLRFTIKAMLNKAAEPVKVRAQFEADAARFFRSPEGANYLSDSLRRPGTEPRGDGNGDGRIALLWASCGRPDRRRVILYLHGGAFIAGSAQTHRHLAAALAGAAGCRAVLPEYRLAPEHPFPAALDDAEATYRHLLETGYDPAAIAIAGESAGAGLVFALVLRLQETGLPPPGCVVGFSPWADMRGQADSLERNAGRDVMLPARRFKDVVAFYLGEDPDVENPQASPVLGSYLSPPPALILASTAEILEDDAKALAARLREAGGDVQIEIWNGLPHAWPIFIGLLRQSDLAVARAGDFISRHLSSEADDTQDISAAP